MILKTLSITLSDDDSNLYRGQVNILDNTRAVWIELEHSEVLKLIKSIEYSLNTAIRVDPQWGETFLPEEKQED